MKVFIFLFLFLDFSFALDEVLFDAASKSFQGTFTLTAFFQSCGIIVFALGILTSIKLALNAFRNPCGGRR